MFPHRLAYTYTYINNFQHQTFSRSPPRWPSCMIGGFSLGVGGTWCPFSPQYIVVILHNTFIYVHKFERILPKYFVWFFFFSIMLSSSHPILTTPANTLKNVIIDWIVFEFIDHMQKRDTTIICNRYINFITYFIQC